MMYGHKLVINIDTTVPSFKTDYQLAIDYFNPHELCRDFKQLLTKEEDKDIYGTEGNFYIQEGFGIIVLQSMHDVDIDDEIVQMAAEQISSIHMFEKVYVQEN